ncbi:MAG TPA: hypothetical protein VLA98_13580 [Solirubrobacteraceae bacterium]|nr:hypothetical protein [Solirubrobacteraceae bacterium]
MTRPALPAVVVAALLATAPAAWAGEPTMPLADVHGGMRCAARSVVHGTSISTFDVEVLDVVAGDRAERAPRILVRVSGPAVDATGVGPGFSGSPITCPAADGTPRVIGALSEGVGDYGGDTALATPIEAILGEPVDPPSSARSGPAAARLLARARPIATPLSIGGLSAPVARAVQRAARRAGRSVLAVPASPLGGFPPAPMAPGAAMAVGYASGDVTAGAIGTVSYVDGDRLWAFGHSLDAVGRRALFLQDAYVYGVIGNPVGTEEASTYKLAAPGHDLGTISADGGDAIAGRVGPAPPSFPLRIVARDLDRGRTDTIDARLADETGVGLPNGASALSAIAPIAVAEAAFTALGSAPARQRGELCVRVAVRESRRPLRFCNTYVGGSGGVEELAGAAEATDVADAAALIDAFDAVRLHITRAEIALRLRRGLHQAFLAGLRGPRTVRRGRTVRLRARLRHAGGGLSWRTIRVRIPRGAPRGRRDLVLVGTPADAPPTGQDGGFEIDLGTFFVGDGAEQGPTTVAGLRRAVAAMHRFDGVRASLVRPGARRPGRRRGWVALRPKGERISGAARVRLRVR